MSDHREAIAEVLAEHEDYAITSNWDAAICRCGVKVCDLNDNATDADTPHRAHLADALLGSDVLAQIRAEARAEAWDEGHAAGRDYQGDGWNSDTHDPREDNPYRAGGATKPGIDWGRMHSGLCPGCHLDKFIGHGPLCVDCLNNRAGGSA